MIDDGKCKFSQNIMSKIQGSVRCDKIFTRSASNIGQSSTYGEYYMYKCYYLGKNVIHGNLG